MQNVDDSQVPAHSYHLRIGIDTNHRVCRVPFDFISMGARDHQQFFFDARSYSTTGPNAVANGGFENGLGAWELLEPNQTVLLSRELPHNGLSSLELVTEQGTNSTGISVLQRFPNGGCKAFPGLAIETDFELSLWHRSPNASDIRYGVSVVFHNGTSKLAINYLLAWKGPVPTSSVEPSLSGGNAYVMLDDSSNSWRQVSLDLRADFIKSFRFDPVVRGYCINYISLEQTSLSASAGDVQPTSFTTGTHSYGFFDDVALFRSSSSVQASTC